MALFQLNWLEAEQNEHAKQNWVDLTEENNFQSRFVNTFMVFLPFICTNKLKKKTVAKAAKISVCYSLLSVCTYFLCVLIRSLWKSFGCGFFFHLLSSCDIRTNWSDLAFIQATNNDASCSIVFYSNYQQHEKKRTQHCLPTTRVLCRFFSLLLLSSFSVFARMCARALFFFILLFCRTSAISSENNFTEMKFRLPKCFRLFECRLFLSFVFYFYFILCLLLLWRNDLNQFYYFYRVIHFGIVSHCLFIPMNLELTFYCGWLFLFLLTKKK